ncbi:hypothetical protein G5I_01310 [Acromyrmex echinatior]|uniref:BED-type domain-containing protein n=1 Tax=Acromyrmex echinatior TaxID=103372 RepID=F4W7A0_ACREC|nr:hypothetical protein G5I_01310 [Acromyrmex echinatior]
MADQQLRGNKIRVFNLRVRQYLRKHYKPSKEKYFGICIYCLSEINYKKYYPTLLDHLTIHHPEVLTEEQKTQRNIHWAWDYFTPTSDGGQCNICSTRITSGIGPITKHLNIHRETHKFFDPDEVIYEYIYMYGASTSASGSMIVEEYEGASIASNLTDDG